MTLLRILEHFDQGSVSQPVYEEMNAFRILKSHDKPASSQQRVTN